MPVVTVQMWTGRSPAQKRALCKAITDAMVEHAGAKPTNLARHHPRKCPRRTGRLPA